MKYHPIPSGLFVFNRRQFAAKMAADSIAIFQSNDLMPRSGDTFFPFRQNNGLFYLSGLDQPETVVVLFPDCTKEGFQELAFIRRPDEQLLRYEGEQLNQEHARQISGIQKIFWLDELEPILHELILLAKRIYVNLEEHDRFQSPVVTRDQRFTAELQSRYGAHKYHRAAPILKKLRMRKSPAEIDLIQQAINITAEAFQEVLKRVEPGVYEYEVEALITAAFLRNRANGHAYEPIVAAGANTCVLHYVQNSRVCRDGDLLLLDFGAEYANYAADLTRTIPVSGRFTERQRQVYEAVLRVQRAASKLLLPGVGLEDYHLEVGRLMESELLGLGLLDKTTIKNQDPALPAYKRYFMHGTSHHLGLDVHDLSNRYLPVQAGMIFTCEPGIYIPEEKIGIRLENNILVTDDGPRDLTERIPIDAEAIEEWMNAGVKVY
jgi:Xaa-Pro aminopeptidase